MIEILIALIAVVTLSIWAYKVCPWGAIGEVLFPMVALVGFCGLFIYVVLGYSYFAAEYKKDIINREYGTDYTRLEVFYASDVIDTVRELDRKRIELNGDLITGK